MTTTDTTTAEKTPTTKSGDTPTAPEQPRLCRCGCGQPTKSTFAQGHDARFVSQLVRRFEKGELTAKQAQAQAAKVSERLGVKAARSLELAAERKTAAKAAKAAKPAKAEAPKPEPTATPETATDAA